MIVTQKSYGLSRQSPRLSEYVFYITLNQLTSMDDGERDEWWTPGGVVYWIFTIIFFFIIGYILKPQGFDISHQRNLATARRPSDFRVSNHRCSAQNIGLLEFTVLHHTINHNINFTFHISFFSQIHIFLLAPLKVMMGATSCLFTAIYVILWNITAVRKSLGRGGGSLPPHWATRLPSTNK